MRIHRVPISKTKLDAIPEYERAFYIQIGHLGNELNMLNKLLLYSSQNIRALDGVQNEAQTSQTLLIVKILAGKLYEGWELTKRAFFGTKISNEYDTHLEEDAKVALEKLKQYFGKQNLINTVRNQYAFHYSPKGIVKQINRMLDTADMHIYLAKISANCLYHISEVIINYAMLESIEPGNHKAAMDRLAKETLDVTSWFTDFIGGCMIVLTQRYLGKTLEELGAVEIEVPTPPRFDEVEIPYFLPERP